MVKIVAGFKIRPIGNHPKRYRAEQYFEHIWNYKQALSENEKAKQAEREKTARLKAHRLAKEAIEASSPNVK